MSAGSELNMGDFSSIWGFVKVQYAAVGRGTIIIAANKFARKLLHFEKSVWASVDHVHLLTGRLGGGDMEPKLYKR
jgi:hypothetical protein